MIRSSPALMTGAVVLSVLLHGAMAWAIFGQTHLGTEGGSSEAFEARIGMSFEDLAVQSLTPMPSGTEALSPEVLLSSVRPAPLKSPPVPTASVAPLQPETLPSRAATAPIPQTPDQAVVADASSELLAALPATKQAASLQPAAMAPSLPPASMISPEPAPTATLQGSTPERTEPSVPQILQVSPRPRERPEGTEETARRDGPETSTPVNRNRNSNAPRTPQMASVTSSARSGPASNKASGNADVSNYPGLVMREISRVRKPIVAARGTTLVRFSVNASGALSSVTVARSSGSTRLDRAALQVIRQAAPFPEPPPGAQRSFQIQIKGQG